METRKLLVKVRGMDRSRVSECRGSRASSGSSSRIASLEPEILQPKELTVAPIGRTDSPRDRTCSAVRFLWASRRHDIPRSGSNSYRRRGIGVESLPPLRAITVIVSLTESSDCRFAIRASNRCRHRTRIRRHSRSAFPVQYQPIDGSRLRVGNAICSADVLRLAQRVRATARDAWGPPCLLDGRGGVVSEVRPSPTVALNHRAEVPCPESPSRRDWQAGRPPQSSPYTLTGTGPRVRARSHSSGSPCRGPGERIPHRG